MRWSGATTFPPPIRLLRRANDCLKLVTTALDMLEHMSPWEYTEVRKVLGHGSGFDSPGFREIRRVTKPLGEAFHAAREGAACRSSRSTRAAASSRISTRSPNC